MTVDKAWELKNGYRDDMEWLTIESDVSVLWTTRYDSAMKQNDEDRGWAWCRAGRVGVEDGGSYERMEYEGQNLFLKTKIRVSLDGW